MSVSSQWSASVLLAVGIAGAGIPLPTLPAAEEHVIIIVRKDEPSPAAPIEQATPPAPMLPQPDRRDQAWLYDHILNDPNQFFIDSPQGPMPLWGMDLVYTADGRPFPKYPHPLVKRLVENPDDPVAYADYLAWRQVAMRRARLTGDRLPEMAIELGIIDESTFRLPDPDDPRAMGLAATTKVESKTLGRPAFTADQQERLGLEGEELLTPGENNAIEIYWFWSPRCEFCNKMARDWFHFANDVQAAGYKAVSITNEQDNPDGYSKLQFWSMRWPVKAVPNIFDWTGMYASFKIRVTPTILFLNRKTGTLRRIDEACDEGTLRRVFHEVAESANDAWPPAPNTDLPNHAGGLRLDRLGKGAFRAPSHAAASESITTPATSADTLPFMDEGDGAHSAPLESTPLRAMTAPAVQQAEPSVRMGSSVATPGSPSVIAGSGSSTAVEEFSDAFME